MSEPPFSPVHVILWSYHELIGRVQRLISNNRHSGDMSGFEDRSHIEFTDIQISIVLLIEFLFGQSERGKRLVEEVSQKASTRLGSEAILGVLKGLKSSYEAGLLSQISEMIEANVTADYMGIAEQLLGEGVTGQYDYIPAAVLTGAVLEDSLRRLCQRQNPSVDIDFVDNNGNKQPKKMNILIDDLKKAGLYNELKAKQLRSWAGVRNAAAHGNFDEFKREDVEQMLAGVQTFLADFL